MTAISMGREEKPGNALPRTWLSGRGKRELIVGISLILLPLLLLDLFVLNIGKTLFLMCLIAGALLTIKGWSRELNFHILKRRRFDD